MNSASTYTKRAKCCPRRCACKVTWKRLPNVTKNVTKPESPYLGAERPRPMEGNGSHHRRKYRSAEGSIRQLRNTESGRMMCICTLRYALRALRRQLSCTFSHQTPYKS